MVTATTVRPSISTEPSSQLVNAILSMYFDDTVSLESIAQENQITMQQLVEIRDHPSTQEVITSLQRLPVQRVTVLASRHSMLALHTRNYIMSRSLNQRLCVTAANAILKAGRKSPLPRKGKKSSPRPSQPGFHAAIPAATFRTRRIFAPIRRLVRHAPYHRPI